MQNRTLAVLVTSLLFSVCTSNVYADGLADLKSSLARLQGSTPLKAVVEARTWNRQGDGKDLEETSGYATVLLEENARGLQVLYSKDTLNKLDAEERAKEKDSKAKTPTLSALNEVNSSALRPMIFASASLSRMMEKATFKAERAETYKGQAARVLSFEFSTDRLSEREKKFVKKYEGTLEVWIAADGTPLACKASQAIHARAYMVVSFDSKTEEEWSFAVVGERLVATRKENRNSGSGMGEKGEGKVVKTLQIQG